MVTWNCGGVLGTICINKGMQLFHALVMIMMLCCLGGRMVPATNAPAESCMAFYVAHTGPLLVKHAGHATCKRN